MGFSKNGKRRTRKLFLPIHAGYFFAPIERVLLLKKCCFRQIANFVRLVVDSWMGDRPKSYTAIGQFAICRFFPYVLHFWGE